MATDGPYEYTKNWIGLDADTRPVVRKGSKFFVSDTGRWEIFTGAGWKQLPAKHQPPEYPEFSPSNMTSLSTPYPFVADHSSYYITLEAFRAFDNLLDVGEYWLTTGSVTGWLEIYIGPAPKVLAYYDIWVNTIPEADRAPKAWTMLGSNTGSFSGEETTLDTVTDETGWSSGEDRRFTCDYTGAAFTYFRIDITANNGDSSYTQIGELDLYGYGESTTWDALDIGPDQVLTNGGMTVNGGASTDHEHITGTTSKSSGKWYFEVLITQGVAQAYETVGLFDRDGSNEDHAGVYSGGWVWFNYLSGNCRFYNNNSYVSGGAFGDSSATPFVIMVAVDFENTSIWFGKNGSWAGAGSPDPATNTDAGFTNVSGTLYPTASTYLPTQFATLRVEEEDFDYTIPSGFSAWG